MNPTSAQQSVIESTASLIIVGAGPGSGKTATAIAKIVHLIKQGMSPLHMIAITFTNAAAREIEERLSKAIGGETRLGYAGTLHGFLLRLLQTNGHFVGYKNGITVFDENEVAELREALIRKHRWKGSVEAVKERIAAGPFAGNRTPLDILATDYYLQLKKQNAMDFDSILFYGLECVKQFKAVQMPFKFLLVDEYQDSGELDEKIYEALPIPNKMFIGDPDQSLYGFRGAKPEIMTNKIFGQAGFKAILHDNYRCGENICTVANRLIKHNANRFDKDTRSQTPYLGAVFIRQFDNAVMEMSSIANEISKSGQPAENFAVLTRSNAQAREIASFIESLGIEVYRKGFRRFPADWAKCRALLNFLTNVDNDELAFKFLRLTTDETITNKVRTKAAEKFTSINAIYYKFKPKTELSELLGILCDFHFSTESRELVSKGISKIGNVNNASISELLMLLAQEDVADETRKGVTVCTIHKAKGREWQIVFVPGCEQGMLPLLSKSASLEEERRIAFVAFTRAKQTLVISHCKTRTKQWGGTQDQKPSQFIAEITKK